MGGMPLTSVHPALASAFLRRGLLLWAGIRLIVQLVRMSASDPTPLSAEAASLIPVIAMAAGYADVRRRREAVLLANLGIGRGGLFLLLAAPPALAELALYVYAALQRAL